MIAVVIFVLAGLALLFPVVMTALVKRKQARFEQAKATIARHEDRSAQEARAASTIIPADHGLLLGSGLVIEGAEPPQEASAALETARAGD